MAFFQKKQDDWEIEVFFDNDCPLCKKEINLLRWLDRKSRVKFTDISAADFQPETYGITFGQFMAEIHGRLPDGSFVVGVEVFRRIYSAIGLGLFVWPTRLFGVRHSLDYLYRVFARNRLRWTGRCDDACNVTTESVQSRNGAAEKTPSEASV